MKMICNEDYKNTKELLFHKITLCIFNLNLNVEIGKPHIVLVW